jgi:hypothetical protein
VSNSWLPTWLDVVCTIVFVGILVVHLGHLAAMTGRSRWWHGSHVLMALGMIDMFWPGDRMVVGSSAGGVIFGVAAGAFFVLAVVEAARGAFSWLWLVAAVDLGAMVYMFAMSSTRYQALTALLAVWFVVEALAWASGRLAAVAQHEALVLQEPRADTDDQPDIEGPSGSARGGAVATSLLAPALAAHHRAVHGRSVRVTLTLMSLGMGYMLLAMQYGMPAMASMTPGSGHMPGMPGM